MRPGVEGWFGWFWDGPELSERMINEGDGGFFSVGDVPALAKKVDLAVGVDPAFQVERQMEVQEGGGRTGARGGAFFLRGFFPRRVWA